MESQVVVMTAHGTTTEGKGGTTATLGFSECFKKLLFQMIYQAVVESE